MKDSAIRRKILEATISSIETYGIEGCTIRNIAKEAGVTLSSVHYYFESKEMLVDKALEMAICGSFDDIEEMLKENNSNIRTNLANILTFFFEGAIKYPGITRAGIYPLLMQGKSDVLFAVKLNAFLDSITPQIATLTGADCETIKLRLMEAFSALFFIGMSPRAFEEFSSISFRDEKARCTLVRSITDAVFR